MTRDQIISYSLLALLLFAIYQVLVLLSPFCTAIFWSGILAFTFHPLYKVLHQRCHIAEGPAAFLVSLLIALTAIPPVILLFLNITQQAIQLYQWALDFVRQGGIEHLIEDLRGLSFVQRAEESFLHWDALKSSLSDWILNSTHALGNYTASQVGTLTRNTFFVLLNGFMMLILTFIFLKDGARIYGFLYNLVPLEEDNKSMIFEQLYGTFSAVIRGQLLTSAVQATGSGVLFWALGVPVPILFAALTFIVSMVPLVGAAGIWFPLVLYLFFQHQLLQAGILLFFGVFFISLIDNFLKPAIIGEKIKLPYFLLFFGILGGMKVYGIMAIFIAPVILSLFFALIRIYREKYLTR